jgi:gluconate 5-dehydrogenase
LNVAALFSLAERVALVTGASSGIGRTIAHALAAAGARVVLVARDEAKLAAARDGIVGQGGHAAVVRCDLTDRDALDAGANAAAEPFGAPDIVVNSAGVNVRKPMLELTRADWDHTMRLNLDAPFFLSQRLVPAMIERGWGRIINIASLQSVRAFANSGAYGPCRAPAARSTSRPAIAAATSGIAAIRPSVAPTTSSCSAINHTGSAGTGTSTTSAAHSPNVTASET